MLSWACPQHKDNRLYVKNWTCPRFLPPFLASRSRAFLYSSKTDEKLQFEFIAAAVATKADGGVTCIGLLSWQYLTFDGTRPQGIVTMRQPTRADYDQLREAIKK